MITLSNNSSKDPLIGLLSKPIQSKQKRGYARCRVGSAHQPSLTNHFSQRARAATRVARPSRPWAPTCHPEEPVAQTAAVAVCGLCDISRDFVAQTAVFGGCGFSSSTDQKTQTTNPAVRATNFPIQIVRLKRRGPQKRRSALPSEWRASPKCSVTR